MTIEMEKSRQAITELASDWFVRSRDAQFSDAEQKDLARWLKESPVHVQEYLAIARLWGDVNEVDGIGDMKIRLSEECVDDNDNVVDITSGNDATDIDVPIPAGRAPQTPQAVPRFRRWAVAASFVMAVSLAGTVWWYENPSSDHHSTDLGEQRSLILADGSVVEMNTDSEIDVNYTDFARHISLKSGEVFFDVKKDPGRPFIVSTGEAEIRVLGTKFNVYKQSAEITVTVVEGNVSVAADRSMTNAERGSEIAEVPVHADSRRVHLKSGEQAIIDTEQQEITTVVLPDLEKYVAWTDRRLIFENTRLDDILSEFARYNNLEYQLSGDQVAELQLTATFDSQDFESLVDYLEFHPAVSVTRRGNIIIIDSAK